MKISLHYLTSFVQAFSQVELRKSQRVVHDRQKHYRCNNLTCSSNRAILIGYRFPTNLKLLLKKHGVTHVHVTIYSRRDGKVYATRLGHITKWEGVYGCVRRSSQLFDVRSSGVDPEDEKTREDDQKVTEIFWGKKTATHF